MKGADFKGEKEVTFEFRKRIQRIRIKAHLVLGNDNDGKDIAGAGGWSCDYRQLHQQSNNNNYRDTVITLL